MRETGEDDGAVRRRLVTLLPPTGRGAPPPSALWSVPPAFDPSRYPNRALDPAVEAPDGGPAPLRTARSEQAWERFMAAEPIPEPVRTVALDPASARYVGAEAVAVRSVGVAVPEAAPTVAGPAGVEGSAVPAAGVRYVGVDGSEVLAVRPVDASGASPPPVDEASVPAGAGAASREDVSALSPSRFSAGAFDPGRRGVRALIAVGVAVLVLAAFLAWRARPQADPVASGDSGPVAAAPAEQAPAPASSAPGEVVVTVAGKVRKPGLVRLPVGARVADAVQAAGGALPGIDITLMNLARKVVDGELIAVGIPPPTPAPQPAGGGTAATGPLNLNTATLAQLDALPGVGPVLAQRILDYRDAHGGFRSVSELRQVEGIGGARYDDLKPLVTV